MPPRRRQPAGAAAQPGSETPRRSERLRLIREASSAQSAAMALRASANSTPTNLPIARASRAITNAPRRRRRRARRWQVPPPRVDATTEADDTDDGYINFRESPSGLLGTLQSFLNTTMIYEPPPVDLNTTTQIFTSTPNLVTLGVPGAVSSMPFFLAPPPRREPPIELQSQQVIGRLKRELLNFQKDPAEGCQAEILDDNLFNWRARITGPPDTPYEGGEFLLDIYFGHDYPFTPPRLYFLTKIYHCNIAATGYICLNILSREWSPALTVAKVLLSIQSLLADPNPDDPLEPTIANEYKLHRKQHDQTAREWTTQYAKPGQAPPEP